MNSINKFISFVFVFVSSVVAFTSCSNVTSQGNTLPSTITNPTEDYWVERIEVTKDETFQEDYADGERFNKKGLHVTAYWNDGYVEEDVPSSNYSVVPEIIYEGVEEVEIIYGEASFILSIVSTHIVGVVVSKLPSMSTYFIGETFNPYGLELSYELNNGRIRPINDFDITKLEFDTKPFEAGDDGIVVKYNGYSVKVPLTILGEGVKMEVNTDPNVSMSEGKWKEGTNATLKEMASNNDFMQNFGVGDVMTFTFESETPQVNLLFQGSSTYVTQYGITNTSWPVVVEDMQVSRVFDMEVNGEIVPISDFAILKGASAPDGVENVKYLANWTEVNLGIVNVNTDSTNTVKLIFKDNGYRNADDEGGVGNVMPAPYIDYLMIGYIPEEKTVTSIKISKNPDKTQYVEGEMFDTTGMEVTAVHKDSTTSLITYYNIIPNVPFDKLGENVITLMYAQKTTTLTVSVIAKVLTGIEIASMPNTVSYGKGQSFDPTGMIVKTIYNNGEKVVINDYTYSPNGILDSSITEITISYKGFTAKVPIIVSDEDLLLDVKIEGVPETEFAVGDELPTISSSSIIVKGFYSSGLEKTYSSNEYDIEIPTGKAQIGSMVIVALKEEEKIITVPLKVYSKVNVDKTNLSGTYNYRTAVGWASTAYNNDFVQALGDGSSITCKFISAKEVVGNVRLTGASSYVKKYINGLPSIIGDMQANKLFDLTINGEKVDIPDSVVFEGKTFEKASNNNLANWSNLDFGNFSFKEGENIVKFTFKTHSYVNSGGASATANIDYITIRNA